MALAVFRDLITSVGPDKHDSSSTFARLIQLTADANTERMSAAHIDETALKALSALPKQFNNKYFYGAWIKQLIGAGEVDGAADVAELMHERGIRLDAKHLNGIVGAWFRNGTKSAQLKAEDFAWAMVHARIALVRKQDYQSQVPSLPSSTHDSAGCGPQPNTRNFRNDHASHIFTKSYGCSGTSDTSLPSSISARCNDRDILAIAPALHDPI